MCMKTSWADSVCCLTNIVTTVKYIVKNPRKDKQICIHHKKYVSYIAEAIYINQFGLYLKIHWIMATFILHEHTKIEIRIII